MGQRPRASPSRVCVGAAAAARRGAGRRTDYWAAYSAATGFEPPWRVRYTALLGDAELQLHLLLHLLRRDAVLLELHAERRVLEAGAVEASLSAQVRRLRRLVRKVLGLLHERVLQGREANRDAVEDVWDHAGASIG